ncbi:tRNA (adenosine(37)-N6)-dimethylallyltransferase MiaA [Maribacter sp. MAR_2009_72]|uniref:tRNA (adenosine(37)-N6)-dimethylallyltransferase MiaA n=1 Tax=Maribacter sp. MAR_2009_72 TaxID=1250050 RepID=UPI0011994C94|nr:tRNA (adenosine(37)-N6)-dimethylallyltransferase MiaA [Maribacter sp. MAR_2009_72]TVZ14445.1 tRNA dimethylallyltransferase [Maribacter sp. MAR_2009_72]
MNKKALISVTGPTAIGKTKLAIALANHFNTEIVSADSRQFFKEMSIGTAVPTTSELAQAKHHFIQHKSIVEPYTVGDFEREALNKIAALFKKHEVVVMVGGSGLYVNAVTEGLNNFPSVSPEIRSNLNQTLENKGLPYLQETLRELDPEYFGKVDVHNPQRVIRALEVCIGSGRPYSTFINKPKEKRDFSVITVGLKADRPVIYDRINKRVDLMMEEGLLAEAKSLHFYKSYNALQTVGYKELFRYFEGEWTLDFAIAEIKKNTRRFAKRQLTWFLKNIDTFWFNYDDNLSTIILKIDEELVNLIHE